jgi:hypothetical protein
VRDALDGVSAARVTDFGLRVDLGVVPREPGRCAVASAAPCLTAPYNDVHAYHLQLAYQR